MTNNTTHSWQLFLHVARALRSFGSCVHLLC